MTSRIFVIVLVIAAAAAAQTPVDELGPHLDELRRGEWTPAAWEHVVTTLMNEGEMRAAGWWVEMARRALDEGLMAPDVAPLVKKLGRRWRAKARLDPEARKVWQRTRRHLKMLAGKKAARDSARLLAKAEDLVVLYPQLESRLAPIRRRVESLGGKFSAGDRKLTDGHKKEGKVVAERIGALIEQRFDLDIAAFERFGCAAGYGPLHAALLRRHPSASAGQAAVGAKLGKLRAAARRLGCARKLEVHVISFATFHMRRGTERLKAGPNAGPLALDVLPGEWVYFEYQPPGRAANAEAVARGDVTHSFEALVRARWDGRLLPIDSWQLVKGEAEGALRPELGGLFLGSKGKPDFDDLVPAEVRRGMGDVVINYKDPKEHERKSGFQRLTMSFSKAHRAMEAARVGVPRESRWIYGDGARPVLALRIPEPK